MKIAVIGAGPSGLVVAKELLESKVGHEVVIFESKDKLGGVFAHSYKGLQLVNNPFIVSFSDFSFNRDKLDLTMPSAEKYVEYLTQYSKHYGVMDKIQFSSEVIKARPYQRKWRIKVKSNKLNEYIFDYLVVCTGIHTTPNIPSLPGQEKFKGKILHGDEIKDTKKFHNHKVVIVGTGEYGSDLAYLIGKTAKTITVVVNRWPAYTIPRYHDNVPTDVDTSRLYHSLPNGIGQSGLSFLLKVKRKLEFKSIKSSYSRSIQMIAEQLNNSNSKVGAFNRITSKTENLARAMKEFPVAIKPKIVNFSKRKVFFEDGSSVESDYVILCTGYKICFPFLDKNLQRNNTVNIRSMYRYMIPEHIENISFIGFVRPGLGSIPPMSEMQARYLALLLSKQKEMPSYDERRRVSKMQLINDALRYPLDSSRLTGLTYYHDFMTTMAKVIGCDIPKLKLLFSEPKVFYKAMTATFSPAQFRLYGPNAKRKESIEIVKNLPKVKFSITIIELLTCLLSSIRRP